MTFNELVKANDMIKTTDIKGKDYAEVNQRVKAFRFLYPNGQIKTNIVMLDAGLCVMTAEIYDEAGKMLGNGTAYEREGEGFINATSYIENCETSAVGRALAFCGIGIDTSIASKEEVENAITAQENIKQKAKAEPKAETKVAPRKPATINEEQKVALLKEMTRTGMDMNSLLAWAKVDTVEQIGVAQYEKTIAQLKTFPNKEDNKTLNDIQKSNK